MYMCVDACLCEDGWLGMNPPDIPQPSQRYGCLFNMCNRQRAQIQSIKSINDSIVRSHCGTWLSSESEELCFNFIWISRHYFLKIIFLISPIRIIDWNKLGQGWEFSCSGFVSKRKRLRQGVGGVSLYVLASSKGWHYIAACLASETLHCGRLSRTDTGLKEGGAESRGRGAGLWIRPFFTTTPRKDRPRQRYLLSNTDLCFGREEKIAMSDKKY